MPERLRFRQLDEQSILQTLTRLRDRIVERFPDSGLARVSDELVDIATETHDRVVFLSRPHWPIRHAAVAGIALLVTILLAIVLTIRVPTRIDGLSDLFQATDAAINELVVLGAIVFFLLTLETRLKRRRALAALHQLRSVAHVVDMHQLTKDPERLALPHHDTKSSPERRMSPTELGRYLDYCSELLALTSKIAALHVQRFDDPVVLAAVNDVETLTTGLSAKVWQKIAVLERLTRAPH